MHDPLEQLAQWRETTDAATEGPWEHGEDDWEGAYVRLPDDGFGVAYVATQMHQGESEGEHDAEFIAISRTAMPALLTAVQAVLDLHRPFKVYDECECTDERKDDGYHVEVNDIGLTCNHIYTVCGECCTDDEYVTEACSYHVHREGEPICPTVKAIRDALGGAK